MDFGNSYKSEGFNLADSIMGEEMDAPEVDTDESKKRSQRIDRSNAKYSEEDFMKLPRKEQLELAEKYWNGPVADFDDGTFQFSYTHFANLCQKLGFRKGIVDTMPEGEASDPVAPSSIIYIEHGRREETEVKKLTLSKSTIDKIDQLLGDKLSNVEKSKVTDEILSQALDQKLADKRVGQFGVAYRPLAEERIM